MENKLYTKAFVEEAGEEEGTLKDAVITSQIVDREGESIDAKGLDFTNFTRNPLLLWSHNAGERNRPAIGKIDKFWQDQDGKTHFTPRFDMEDSFAKEIYSKFKRGFLNAFSIGFIAKEKKDSTIKKAEVLEFSAVNIPANPDALVTLRSKGFEINKDFSEWAKKEEEEVKPEPEVTEATPEEQSILKEIMDEIKKLQEEVSKLKPKETSAPKVEPKQDEQAESRTTRLLRQVYTELGKELRARKIND